MLDPLFWAAKPSLKRYHPVSFLAISYGLTTWALVPLDREDKTFSQPGLWDYRSITLGDGA